jgi:glycosyltransferase involved in cell wall biosynthesis
MPVVLDVRVVTGAGGGPEKTIMSSPRFLARQGYKMLCAYMHPPQDSGFTTLQAKAAEHGAEFLSVTDRGAWDWQVLPQLLDLCRRHKVQIWHGHDYKSNLLGLLVRRTLPIRLVTTVHGWVERTRRTPLYYCFDRLSLRYYEKVLCVSPDLYQACRRAGVAAKRCLLLENGIDTEKYRRTTPVETAKKALGIPNDRIVLGAVGRLSAEKGFDLLIRSVQDLLQQGANLQLLIFGEGPERVALQSQIAFMQESDRVRLMGYQPKLQPFFEAMDLFVLSSLREGLPNVVLEAMAMEVPVVSTRVAGIPRLIQDSMNGSLIESGSSQAITHAISALLSDKPRQLRYRMNGRKTVETHYCFARRMQKLAQIYDDMLSYRTAS